MRSRSSLAGIAFSLLICGCNLAFPLDGYGTGTSTGTSTGGPGAGGSMTTGGAGAGGAGGTSTTASAGSAGAAGSTVTPHLYVFGGETQLFGPSTDKIFAAPIGADGSVGTFAPSGSMKAALGLYAGAASADHVFALTGFDQAGQLTNKAQVGTFDGQGSFTWTSINDLPAQEAASGRTAVVYQNHLYVLGGSGAGKPDWTTWIGDLDAAGLVTSWKESAVHLPSGRQNHATVVDGAGRVYLIGGVEGSGEVNNVDMATLQPAGGVSPWVKQQGLPNSRSYICAVLHGGYIYVIAGRHAGGDQSDIFRAKPDASGQITGWVNIQEGVFTPRNSVGCTVFGDRLYIAGGFSNNTPIDDVRYIPILSNGDLDAQWTQAPSLPQPVAGAFLTVR